MLKLLLVRAPERDHDLTQVTDLFQFFQYPRERYAFKFRVETGEYERDRAVA
jgi:hypothetical protein